MSESIGSAYYRGRTLLITGGTGFVGQVLLEALLRTAPGIRRIYLMIRPRVDPAGQRRSASTVFAEDILPSSAFDSLRACHGTDFNDFVGQRVFPFEGDLTRDELAFDADSLQRIRREVDLVINSGALAIFDAPLDEALQSNTLGPQRILSFAQSAKLRPFVAHISTCYVNSLAGPVFETTLDTTKTPSGQPFDVEEEIKALRERIARIKKRHSGDARRSRLIAEGMRWARRRGWRDTYTFTKALGEQLIVRHKGNHPCLILRPSIIESARRTPAPGWIEGYRMLDPLIVGFGRGQLREFPGNPDSLIDVIPVDTAVNALLAAIPWTHHGPGSFVYQVATGMEKPLTLRAMHAHVVDYFTKKPLRRLRNDSGGQNSRAQLPKLTFPPLKTLLRKIDFRYLLPLRILEAILRTLQFTSPARHSLATLRARRVRLEWLRNTASIYGPYAESQPTFLTHNLRPMWEALPEADRQRWPFLVGDLDWGKYFQEIHLPGIERYLLRMPQALQTAATARTPLSSIPAESPGNTSAANPVEPDARAVSVDWRRAERLLTRIRQCGPDRVEAFASPQYKECMRRVGAGVIRLICKRRLSLKQLGSEHLPSRGPFILIANHSSHVDTGVLLTALGPLAATTHPTAAADYWYRSRIIAWLLSASLGAIPFDRFAHSIPRALGLPVAVLRFGHSLIFYPEGSRSVDGRMRPFKRTLGLLALASGAPILPVHIKGAAKALPKGKTIIKSHPVSVRFGPLLRAEPYLRQLDRKRISDVAKMICRDAEAAVRSLDESSVDLKTRTSRTEHRDGST